MTDRREEQMTKKQVNAIAISRQLGSGGSYIGYLAAKELGFKFIDREILRQAAKHLGIDEGLLEEYDERSSSLIQSITRIFSFATFETAYVPPLKRPFYGRDLFTLECRIMNEIVDQHNAVIVGRGGFYALKDRPDVVRVLIHAPKDFRIKRVMNMDNITEREARAKVEESDQRRMKFVRDIVGVDWMDAQNYHLCIDSSIAGFPECVEMIIKLVHKKDYPD